MTLNWKEITHVTKIDPTKNLAPNIEYLEQTDLVIVGGSDGVTTANTIEVLQRVQAHAPEMIVVQEPYSSTHVSSETIDAVDYLAVPAVYNGNRTHFIDKHIDIFTEIASKPHELFGSALPIIGDTIRRKGRGAVGEIANKIIGEGYVIQNLDCTAAAISGVESVCTPKQIAGVALATEVFYRFPIFYVEYSGTYGGPEDVATAAAYLTDTVLLYGGGIKTRQQTNEILAAGADAIVVGDCFHDDSNHYLQTIPEGNH